MPANMEARLDAAANRFRAIAAQNPRVADALTIRDEILTELHDLEEAVSQFEQRRRRILERVSNFRGFTEV